MLGRLLPPVFRHAVKPALAILLGLAATTSLLFANGEPGARFKAYDPNSLMQRRNLLTYSGYTKGGVSGNVAAGAVAPTGWVFINAATGGTITYQGSRRYIDDNELRFVTTVGTQRPAIGQSYTVQPGQTYVQSFYVEAIASGSAQLTELCNAGGIPSGTIGIFRINGIERSALTLVQAGDFVENVFTIGATGGSLQVRLGPGAAAGAVVDVTLSSCQFEQGSVATSYQKVTDWVTEYLGGEPLVRRNLATNTGFQIGDVGALPTYWIERGLVTGRKITDPTASSGYAMRVTSGGGSIAATDDVRHATITGLTVGVNYTVKFKAKRAPGYTNSTMLAAFGAAASGTQTLTDAYQPISFTHTATGASHGLFFGGAAGALYDVTDIEVLPTSIAATAYQPITDWTTEFAADEARRLAIRSKVTMWQDNLGVTPVTKVEDPVGLWQDVKRGVERGPELISNGTFDSATTGWTANGTTLSIDAGRLKAVTTNTGDSGAYQDIATVPGAVYEALCSVDNAAATAGAGIRVTTTAYADTALSNNIAAGASGQARLIFRATAWTMRISLDRRAASAVTGDIAYFDNISVREVGYVRGAELVTNGAFNSGTTGWTASGAALSVASGELTVTGSASTDRATQTITSLIVGRSYELTGDVISGTANPVITAWAMPGFSTNLGTTSGTGQKRLIFTATTTQIELWLRVNAGTGVFDNVSVREIPTELGAELVTAQADREFSSDTGFWTKGSWTISGGTANSDGTSSSAINSTVGVVGSTYAITYTVSNYVSGSVVGRAGGTNASTNRSANGTYTDYVVCGATSNAIGVFSNLFNGSVDNISIREIVASAPKNASQPTAINRPKLDARVNKLVSSEDLNAAAWVKGSSSVTPKPDGYGDKIVELAATTEHYVQQGPSGTAGGGAWRGCVEVKAGERTFAEIRLQSPAGACRARVNLTTGAVYHTMSNVFGTTWTVGEATAVPSERAGYWRITINGTCSDTSAASVALLVMAMQDASTINYLGDGVSGIYATKADLRTAADAALNIPAYQRVTSATDYDTAGFPHRVKANGTNQWMVTPVIDFTGTDKVTVIAGVNVASDNGQAQVLSEFSTDSSLNPAFNLNIQGATDTFAARSTGTISSTAATPGGSVVAPQNTVLGMSSSIATDSLVLRMNGTQLAASAGDQGSGNFGAFPLYLFSRAGTSLFANAGLSEYVVRGAATDTATLARAERELARNSMVVM
jgi:hypothetical protein